jgi:hypothetical protein
MAWNFLAHASSYDMWMYWAEKYGGPMTPRKDVFRDAPVFQSGHWPVLGEGFQTSHSVEPIVPIFKIWTELYTMVQQVLLDEMTAEEAARTYKVKIDKMLAEY